MKNKIIYDGHTFVNDQIKESSIHLAASLPSMKLEANTFTAVVKSSDKTLTDFKRNTPLYYYHNNRQLCITYVQTVDRIAPNKYKFYGTSAIGRLIEQPHAGGIYTGQTVEDVIADICGPVPFIVKTVLKDIKLYGWLPYASPPKRSARDNLVQVLFAIGAAVRTDLDGVLRINGLWDGISNDVGMKKMYTGATTDYDGSITKVIVTEHQYTAGTETKRLFEGTAQAGDVITFDEPMHSLTATGFSIQASGANWARVSAGTGTLSGKTYIHNTRQVTRDVQQAAAPNVKTVEDATLVSLVNASAVAQRLADYYKCRQRVDAQVVYTGELPGDRLATYHPFDKTGVDACMESADITISNTLAAKEKLLVGYVPPQFEDVQYLDTRVVLTGSGQWDPPEGVTNVRYVLFSGAQGGRAGLRGESCGSPRSHSYGNGQITLFGPGGKGGQGGPGGKGSKILQGELQVSHGTPVSYSCGVGGLGADFNSSSPVDGSEGGATTFGSLSTASGSYPPSTGWQDPVTGEIFAVSGPEGLPGGDGAGSKPGYEIPPGTGNLSLILVYQPSTGAYDEDGKLWAGAGTREYSADIAWYSTPWPKNNTNTCGGQAGYALGPGGVAGVTQSTPTTRGTVNYTYKNIYNKSDKVRAVGADGQTPPAPTLVPKKQGLTIGGRGGYGGGGASATGYAGGEAYESEGAETAVTAGSTAIGGPGGKAGPGGDGMIILFYSIPKKTGTGQLVDKNGKMVLDRFRRRVIV